MSTIFRASLLPIFLANKGFIKTIFPFVVTLLLSYLLVVQASAEEKKPHKKTKPSVSKVVPDEKKFDELKLGDANIWRCENNVLVKTAESTQGFLMLWNKKLYIMNKIDALKGVDRYTNDIHHLNWVEIPDKAMLFDFKIGQRLLDSCKTPERTAQKLTLNQEDLLK